MKKILTHWLKKLFSDLHSAIVATVLGLIFVSGAGIYFFLRKLWNALIKIMQSPTPLWATIALVLLSGVYIYLRTKKIHSSDTSSSIEKYFTIGNFKWKAQIYKNGSFEVDEYPYCIKHDLKFIFRRGAKCCPGTEKEKCSYELRDSHFSEAYQAAKSIIENKIRNKDY